MPLLFQMLALNVVKQESSRDYPVSQRGRFRRKEQKRQGKRARTSYTVWPSLSTISRGGCFLLEGWGDISPGRMDTTR